MAAAILRHDPRRKRSGISDACRYDARAVNGRGDEEHGGLKKGPSPGQQTLVRKQPKAGASTAAEPGKNTLVLPSPATATNSSPGGAKDAVSVASPAADKDPTGGSEHAASTSAPSSKKAAADGSKDVAAGAPKEPSVASKDAVETASPAQEKDSTNRRSRPIRRPRRRNRRRPQIRPPQQGSLRRPRPNRRRPTRRNRGPIPRRRLKPSPQRAAPAPKASRNTQPADVDAAVARIRASGRLKGDPTLLDRVSEKAKTGDEGALGKIEALDRSIAEGEDVEILLELQNKGVRNPDHKVGGKSREVKTGSKTDGDRTVSRKIDDANNQIKNSALKDADGKPQTGDVDVQLRGDSAKLPLEEVDRQVRRQFNAGRSRSLDRVRVFQDGELVGE